MLIKTIKHLTKKCTTVIEKHRFIIEVVSIVFIAGILFWFAQAYDAFEQLVELSRKYEEWELDEFFTLLMISAVALIAIITRNASYLRAEMQRRMLVEEEIKRLAFYDGLTGLPNRGLCLNRLEHTLAHATRGNTMAVVMFIDLDDFKKVNDSLGHDGGDELLKQASERLSNELRTGDTLARIAGDEFVIILESVFSISDISALAERLIDKISQPFIIQKQEAYVGISVGIAIFPNDGESSQQLMKNADTAMYYAKHSGKNTFKFFSVALNKESEQKQKIARQLRKAIARNEFTLYFQPVVNVTTGAIKGAEALLRWNSFKLGNIEPSVFIPIAEEIGIITSIGEWVLFEVCKQNKRWQDLGYTTITVSVNISAKELSLRGFAKLVERTLAVTNLEAKYLGLELTETAIKKDPELSIQQLEYLSGLGVVIALDDFGKGYSSMSYLRKLQLSRIKIDRSFIQRIPHNREDTIVTNAIVTLANNLGLKITAEGIETKEQYEFIRTTLTDSAQGFYFSRAVSAEEFALLLQKGVLPPSH
ncbi:EAL domain-containing protein [Colwellia sp. D2M02]|uniref:putative bifunctional diguanylate cyclase/phosphodiesterase n=1 Tax=Colwellia sp. D2M02 TaxID=2841562 RepID=UPI001C08977E|nr:EAL domain-containing protein [Colwellia sp. D2M02]MBU2894751.1 EAL domain-containing protein [Colwellia sp. D2M02]